MVFIEKKIKELLRQFQPVSLKEINELSLMVRRDRKYVFPLNKLLPLLEELKVEFQILSIDGILSQHYSTVYFDTPAFDLYLMHHRGKMNRQKIRLRKYNSDGASFLEIKRKSNLGLTNKSRVAFQGEANLVMNEEESFIRKLTPFNGDQLMPSILNEFQRITLINFSNKERITIDYGIEVKKADDNKWMDLEGICIAEIKRNGQFYNSIFARKLKQHKIYPMRFSKYCYGVVKLIDGVPKNRFKEKYNKVDRISTLQNNT